MNKNKPSGRGSRAPSKVLLTVVLAFGISFCSAGCGAEPTPATENVQKGAAPAVPSVRVVHPERKTVRHPIEQPGFNIEPFQETPLYAKISGFVSTWSADMGDTVRKGAVLAVLNVPEMQVDLSQREAAVRHASAQIEQAKATVLTAKAQLQRAKSQYERFARIGKGGVLDQDNVDEARLGYEAAKANIEKAKADVAAAEAQLEVNMAKRDFAKTMLEYTQIRAPYDGVITQRQVNTGDFVQPVATGQKGEALFVIDQVDPVRVFVNVPGSDASWIKDGDSVSLRLQGAGGQLLQGHVTRTARSLDPHSRTLRTEIDLPNTERRLLPGMYVQATISIQHENVWTLPASAVFTAGDQLFCARVIGGRAVRTPLQVGLTGNGLVEVLKKQEPHSRSGEESLWTPFTGQEQIIAADAATVAEGQSVQIADTPR